MTVDDSPDDECSAIGGYFERATAPLESTRYGSASPTSPAA
jgi:hypothetical protein